mgnify:CR=1 FL=1|jgi:multicomponent Na+:H+ antiporter subunit E
MAKIFLLLLFVFALEGSCSITTSVGIVTIVMISIVLTRLFCKHEQHDLTKFKVNYKLLLYFVRLAKEIFSSTMHVCTAILFKKKSRLHPIFDEIKTKQISNEARVLFGNSITLTPGTITTDISKDRVCVHAINAECLRGSKQLDLKIIRSQK